MAATHTARDPTGGVSTGDAAVPSAADATLLDGNEPLEHLRRLATPVCPLTRGVNASQIERCGSCSRGRAHARLQSPTPSEQLGLPRTTRCGSGSLAETVVD